VQDAPHLRPGAHADHQRAGAKIGVCGAAQSCRSGSYANLGSGVPKIGVGSFGLLWPLTHTVITARTVEINLGSVALPRGEVLTER
jgi:hypothetical protein